MDMASGYNQPITYGQPIYNATTGPLQNGVQQQHWSESNTPSSLFAAQSQTAQQMNGQQLQQPHAQQVYSQQMQGVQPYGQQLAQPPFGQQGGVGQQAYVPQMPGQQVVQAPAAVVGAQYCAQGEQIFFVNEKWASLSRDDFSILDSNKQPIFKMDSSAFSVTQKRVLKTAKGQAVCSLKKKVAASQHRDLCGFPCPYLLAAIAELQRNYANLLLLQLLSSSCPTWFMSLGANASDKERIAVIKKDTYNGAHSASMYLNSNTTQFFSQPVPDYQARGDVKNRSFFIYKGTMPVAEVSMKTTLADILNLHYCS